MVMVGNFGLPVRRASLVPMFLVAPSVTVLIVMNSSAMSAGMVTKVGAFLQELGTLEFRP